MWTPVGLAAKTELTARFLRRKLQEYEALKAEIEVSGNWRIVFRFEDGDAYDVNYEDYH